MLAPHFRFITTGTIRWKKRKNAKAQSVKFEKKWCRTGQIQFDRSQEFVGVKFW